MSLNIKDARTHDLVRELARRTGTSQTAAVREAVAAQLDALNDAAGAGEADEREQRAAAVRQVAAAFREALEPEAVDRIRAADGWLYDADGLPR